MAQDLNPFSEIRKESLDIYNRLHSIEEDLDFVNAVHGSYPELPLIRASGLPSSVTLGWR
jgi:tRNA A64-2'-O-ribosylphosphate transferase